VTERKPIEDMTEQERAAFYEEHKGDLSLWESKGQKMRVPPEGVSTVFRLPIEPKELEELYWAAKRAGLSLSDFMRRAALDRARDTSDRKREAS
jgi:hypothetical protein